MYIRSWYKWLDMVHLIIVSVYTLSRSRMLSCRSCPILGMHHPRTKAQLLPMPRLLKTCWLTAANLCWNFNCFFRSCIYAYAPFYQFLEPFLSMCITNIIVIMNCFIIGLFFVFMWGLEFLKYITLFIV